MKDKRYVLNTLLAIVLGTVLLAAVLVRTFAPLVILPELGGTELVLISLAALLLDHYLAPGAKRCYPAAAVFSAVTFGLLPFAGCFAGAVEALWLGVSGGVVFTVTAWLFTSIQDRISTGPACKAAPAISALGVYLAAQCLMGLF